MIIPEDSIFALIVSQPLVLWSLVVGILILISAITLALLSNIRRKNTAVSPGQHVLQIEPTEAPSELVAELFSDLDEPSEAELEMAAQQDEAEDEPKINPLAAIAEEETAEEGDYEAPQPQEVEVNSKLADLFHNDIIVDPYVQALRDSLDDVPMAELLTQIRTISSTLSQHVPTKEKHEA
ncbi:MAG: hypothetical protein DHS20C20_18190 [Ardenticatenaceae bacterium]|nr:MAG: hypothetical protein DHS20C20_18190 [Ardenticatenaceae bacterium]